jgi:hypothetical protein
MQAFTELQWLLPNEKEEESLHKTHMGSLKAVTSMKINLSAAEML